MKKTFLIVAGVISVFVLLAILVMGMELFSSRTEKMCNEAVTTYDQVTHKKNVEEIYSLINKQNNLKFVSTRIDAKPKCVEDPVFSSFLFRGYLQIVIYEKVPGIQPEATMELLKQNGFVLEGYGSKSINGGPKINTSAGLSKIIDNTQYDVDINWDISADLDNYSEYYNLTQSANYYVVEISHKPHLPTSPGSEILPLNYFLGMLQSFLELVANIIQVII